METKVLEKVKEFVPEEVVLNAFEKIKGHFSQPGAKLSFYYTPISLGSSKKCKYRLDQTPGCPTRCGIGVLIPDDKYDVRMEGVAASTSTLPEGKIPVWPVLEKLGFDSYISRRVVTHIQQAHDGAKTVEAFLEDLEKLKQLYLSGQFDY